MFEVGSDYRRAAILAEYGGQRQSGIVTPRNHPLIFAFTGSGETYGYNDEWRDGVFVYSGEGQIGDMMFTGGNKAIRDHVHEGEELHLFERRGKGMVRYLGQFACTGYEWSLQPDRNGTQRQAIRFHLAPEAASAGASESLPEPPPAPKSKKQVDELRVAALAAAAPAAQSTTRESKRNFYERSRAVRDYVLARANGTCEACDDPAPFLRKNGTPYLEPHHTRRVSDGGPDHPRSVGAVCPTCHRRIHYGEGGAALNAKLERTLTRIEDERDQI